MNTKTALAIFAIAAAITLVLAPASISQASARQTATENCVQNGEVISSGPCPGSSGGQNPNREETCTAKNAGQQEKLC
jgi:hypothetical protein